MPAARKSAEPRTRGRRRPAEAAAPAATYDDRPWVAAYPAGVPADYEFPDVPLTALLDEAAAAFPTTVAVAFLGTRISYRELRDAVDRFATALAALGVRKGDRVALVLPNCPQNVIAFFAALRLGAVVVQHNPLYTEAELRHQLADCGAEVVVCLDRTYAAVRAVQPDTAVREIVVTSVIDYLPGIKRYLAPFTKQGKEISTPIPSDAPVRRFVRLLRSARTPARQVPIDPRRDLALLQYTGGTTGLSKGAMLTHYNLVANAYQNRLWLTDVRAGREVMLTVLPLFHAYGLTVCMNTGILLGATLVLLPKFDLDLVFEAVDQWKPTLFPGVPPIYKAMIDSPQVRQHDLRSIRACISGAMKLPVETQEQFERISGGRLVEGYGMTETSPSTHSNPIYGTRKPGSIGLPLPGTECRIVDQDDPGKPVPIGEPGELAVRGPQVFRGYWNRPDETAQALTDDGWLLTGDVAVMDEDGFFAIVDRKKELIIAGGFNIYPSEVEEVLFRHEGIADCVVVGVPDRYRGETVKAYVVPKPGAQISAEDVQEFCAKSLTAYKVPKLVEFRDALPRTMVGKVLRRVLLEEERAKAAAAEEPKPASRPGARSGGRPAEGPPAAKSPANKSPAKSTAKKSTAVKSPAKKSTAKKVTAQQAAAKQPAAKKSAAKKSAAKRRSAT